jgi:hypothetical protein
LISSRTRFPWRIWGIFFNDSVGDVAFRLMQVGCSFLPGEGSNRYYGDTTAMAIV